MRWPRRAPTVALAAAGLVLGSFATLAIQRVPSPGSSAPRVGSDVGSDLSQAAPKPVGRPPQPLHKVPPPSPVPPGEQVLLIWVSGGLPDGFAERVAGDSHVSRVTVVRGALQELIATWNADGQPVDTPPEGYAVPIDTIGIDPGTYAAFLPPSSQQPVTELRPGFALLGSTSAKLRRLGPGGLVALADGSQVTISGIIDDTAAAGAELVVPAEQLDAKDRYLLIGYEGDRAAVEEAIRALAPPGLPLRTRAPGETPWLRHGDAVLPQVFVKERFGEFAYRRTAGRDVALEPGWAEGHVAAADVPLLGHVRCHRELLGALTGAMNELAKRNLGYLVDPGGFAGCFVARLTTSQESISRHAWGAAVDINVGDNPVGGPSSQDPRLVEVMRRWGFTWGGEWLIPDPAHFEYVRDPQGTPAVR